MRLRYFRPVFVLGWLLLSMALQAQPTECGTVTPSQDPIPPALQPAYQQFEQQFLQQYRSGQRNSVLDTVPIQVHVVRTSSGTGGITVSDLTAAFNIVNNYYANANMYFKYCNAINYINSNTYYDFDASDEAALRAAHNVSNVINIYFFNSITSGSGSSLCGYAYFAGGPDFIAMANSCATNGSTLSHEIGHYFNLYHTHETSTGQEYVNGSNCSTTGDLLCDTPADPVLGTSNVNTSCQYTGTAVDPLGTPYNPDPTNIMSYSRKTCRNFFSPQQYARMSFTNINSRAYLSCSTSGGGGGGLINGCAAATQYPASTLTPTTSWQVTTQSYAGEYQVYSVTAGIQYEWSTCSADGGSASYDTELTLTDANNNELAYNDDYCGAQSKITWTATTTGTVRVHLTAYRCQSNSVNTTIAYRAASSGQPNLTSLGSNSNPTGNNVAISFNIGNTGTAPSGAFDIRIYASTNTTITTSDIPLATESFSSIAAGSNATRNVNIDLCNIAALSNATYYIGYLIDYNNQVTESDESDNDFYWSNAVTRNCSSGGSGCIATTQYPANTLTPSTSWQVTTQSYAGEYQVYSVTAGDQYEWSTCSADGGSASYDTELTLTDASNNQIAYNDDFCGAQSKLTWTATFTGTVRVHLSEYQCQSNSINTTIAYRKQSAGIPDLTDNGTSRTVTGNVMAFTLNMINNGTAASGSFDVRLYASTNTSITTADIPLQTVSFSSLSANASTSQQVSVDLCTVTGLPDGAYYIGYLIDYNNQVTESDETNNAFLWNTVFNLSCQPTQFTVTVSANPSNAGTATGGGTFAAGQTANLNATANSGYQFQNWTVNGNVVSTASSYGFMVNSNISLVANFIPAQYTIAATATPAGAGSITGAGSYYHGQPVTLTASPNAGYQFDSWKENGVTVSASASYSFSALGNRTLTAHFAAAQYTLTVTADSLTGGSVTGGGTYSHGDLVTVTANPQAGWLFEGWYEGNLSGTLLSNSPVYQFSLTSNRTLMANFNMTSQVNNQAFGGEIILFPNPAKQQVTLDWKGTAQAWEHLTVFNALGQVVHQESLQSTGNQHTIDVHTWSPGLYTIRIQLRDTAQFALKRLLIQR